MRLTTLISATVVLLGTLFQGATAQDLSALSTPLATPDGEQVVLSELGKGKVFIISFGATWCVPCKKEMMAVNDIYGELQENGIEYVAVFIDNTKTMAKVGPFVKAKKFEFPVLLDPNETIFDLVNGTEVPYMLVYDANGVLHSRHDGYLEGDEEHLMEEALELVKQAQGGAPTEEGNADADTAVETAL